MKLKLTSNEQVETLINIDMKKRLLDTKNKINQFYNIKIRLNNNYQTSKWEYYRSLLNKYETIPKHKGKMNRAYFKLKELLLDHQKHIDTTSAATLAEGPGGFIQLLNDTYPNMNVYGITLRYGSEVQAQNRHMKDFSDKNVKIIYGNPENPSHDGNLYNKEVVNAFAERVKKVDLVTADGGFEAKNENNKEVEHLKLFLAESLTAFKVLNKGGTFILKIYDIFTRPTLELLFLLSSVFKNVNLVKPVSSRPANSERYVVCLGFKGFKTDIHVDDNDVYSSILDMTAEEKEKFKLFTYNLEKQNEKYVETIIAAINEVVNYIQMNENNKNANKEREREQEIYKQVWEKVYERQERKEKRAVKKDEKKMDKQFKEFEKNPLMKKNLYFKQHKDNYKKAKGNLAYKELFLNDVEKILKRIQREQQWLEQNN